MYSISLVSLVVTLNTSVTEKVKNAKKSTVSKLINIVFYQSPAVISCYTKHILF